LSAAIHLQAVERVVPDDHGAANRAHGHIGSAMMAPKKIIAQPSAPITRRIVTE